MNPPQLSLEFHPFANMFPLLSETDAALLRKSLKETGQLDAIVLLGGKILEGRNRYRELVALGVQPVTEEYDPVTHGPDPLEYVWAKNYIRRHLSASQRSAVAAEYAKAKAEAQGGKGKTDAVNEAAAQMHVAPSQVHNAQKLQTEAPDLFAAVKSGGKTVHAAMGELKEQQNPTPPNVVEFPAAASSGPPVTTAPVQIDGNQPDPPDTKPAKKKTAGKGKAKKKDDAAGETPPAASEAPQETLPAAPAAAVPKDDEELKKTRAENFETVKHLHGDEFADAFKKGTVLKTVKELKAFVKCNDNEQCLIVPYIVQGWEVARATKFVIKSIDTKDPIQDLIFRFVATGKKSETFKVGGFSFTVKKD